MKQTCPICKKEFYVKPSRIKNGGGTYCSLKCFGESRKIRTLTKCFWCNKNILLSNSRINRSKSGNYYCSNECVRKYIKSHYVEELHPNWKDGKGTYRQRAFRYYGLCCANEDECPLRDVSLPYYMFDVHHIDGNRDNNKKENLKVYCVWCHRKLTIKIIRGRLTAGFLTLNQET